MKSGSRRLSFKRHLGPCKDFTKQETKLEDPDVSIKEEQMDEDIKKELIIDLDSSVKTTTEELPENNTANSAPPSLVVLD